ncbi:MAG: hypothetical protein LUM44_17835 [Pyrinomonadaceae bacterium]|nr:hypothetical protein [Pyrinomonadaceae bacterium]
MELISQEKAKIRFRNLTGLSHAASETAVKNLPKVADGKREKVYLSDVDSAARQAVAPKPGQKVEIVGMRPRQKRVIERIQRMVAGS